MITFSHGYEVSRSFSKFILSLNLRMDPKVYVLRKKFFLDNV